MKGPGTLWLPEVGYAASPNADARPAGTVVDTLVIHNISLPPGQFGGGHIHALFDNRIDPQAHPYFAEIHSLRVSAHLLIERDGSTTQFVSLDRRAWHAGQSAFCGRTGCNDFSIGIELEGTDTGPFSDAQYRRLAEITRRIQEHFPAITQERIVGHSDIAPGRKTDPGPCFDWARYHALLSASITAPNISNG